MVRNKACTCFSYTYKGVSLPRRIILPESLEITSGARVWEQSPGKDEIGWSTLTGKMGSHRVRKSEPRLQRDGDLGQGDKERIGAEVPLATPLGDTRRLVSVSRIW